MLKTLAQRKFVLLLVIAPLSAAAATFWVMRPAASRTIEFEEAGRVSCHARSSFVVGAITIIDCRLGENGAVALDPEPGLLIERNEIVEPSLPTLWGRSVIFRVQPERPGRFALVFRVWTNLDVSGLGAPPLPAEQLVVAEASYSWLRRIVTALFVGLLVGTSLLLPRLIATKRAEDRLRISEARRRIEQAEINADKAPERAKFAWDLARVKLEAYFDRNLAQVNQVFWLAVTVMLVGFAFVLWGVIVQLAQPRITPTTLVAGISGIITQFIGATFLVIYRSTMVQANEFISILERINTVGMAVQVLDSIPESLPDLKSSTRAEIITLLLSANIGRPVPRHKSDARHSS